MELRQGVAPRAPCWARLAQFIGRSFAILDDCLMMKSGNMIGMAALLAAGVAPSIAAAQSASGSTSSIPRYHLMQVSVDARETPPAQFKAQTEAIKSCSDAKSVAKSLGADVKRNRFTRASLMGPDLQQRISELKVGEATEVYTDGTGTLRVLVLCGRA